MREFSPRSLQILGTCDERLQRIANEALKVMDIAIVQGYRSNEEQALAFEAGKSQKKPGQSKHNVQPARAMDITPYPLDWDNKEQFCLLAGIILGIANQLGIRVRWGGDWNGTNDPKKNGFSDMDHFELMEES